MAAAAAAAAVPTGGVDGLLKEPGDLPNEVWIEIFTQLSLADRLRAKQVCRIFGELVEHCEPIQNVTIILKASPIRDDDRDDDSRFPRSPADSGKSFARSTGERITVSPTQASLLLTQYPPVLTDVLLYSSNLSDTLICLRRMAEVELTAITTRTRREQALQTDEQLQDVQLTGTKPSNNNSLTELCLVDKFTIRKDFVKLLPAHLTSLWLQNAMFPDYDYDFEDDDDDKDYTDHDDNHDQDDGDGDDGGGACRPRLDTFGLFLKKFSASLTKLSLAAMPKEHLYSLAASCTKLTCLTVEVEDRKRLDWITNLKKLEHLGINLYLVRRYDQNMDRNDTNSLSVLLPTLSSSSSAKLKSLYLFGVFMQANDSGFLPEVIIDCLLENSCCQTLEDLQLGFMRFFNNLPVPMDRLSRLPCLKTLRSTLRSHPQECTSVVELIRLSSSLRNFVMWPDDTHYEFKCTCVLDIAEALNEKAHQNQRRESFSLVFDQYPFLNDDDDDDDDDDDNNNKQDSRHDVRVMFDEHLNRVNVLGKAPNFRIIYSKFSKTLQHAGWSALQRNNVFLDAFFRSLL